MWCTLSARAQLWLLLRVLCFVRNGGSTWINTCGQTFEDAMCTVACATLYNILNCIPPDRRCWSSSASDMEFWAPRLKPRKWRTSVCHNNCVHHDKTWSAKCISRSGHPWREALFVWVPHMDCSWQDGHRERGTSLAMNIFATLYVQES